MLPYTEEANKLFLQGAEELALVESNGIRIDVPYLQKAMKRVRRKIKHIQTELEETDVLKTWRKKYKRKTNLESGKQLGDILFDEMGFPCKERTEHGRPKTDEHTLSKIKHPFIKKYLEAKKLDKLLNTHLKGLQTELVGEFIHPFFNLHIATTYRSSSSVINFQNIPIRNPVTGKIIRQAFISRPGRHIVETDYGGIEVAIATCYHKDPNMISYIKDPTKDMHRDMAMECFLLPKKEITGHIRYIGKNCFVFPEFYGNWYMDCAKSLWEAISEGGGVETKNGIDILSHLEAKGFPRLGKQNFEEGAKPGTFEYHIKNVEERFWSERFKRYAQWKKEWYDNYRSKGWFLTKTGFICQGYMPRNEAINYPVQGSAFHCLLRSLIRLNQELRKRKMKSLIVGQIHDSIVADVPDKELDDYIALTKEIMIDELVREWTWIIVPIKIETEVAPINGNWHQKVEVK